MASAHVVEPKPPPALGLPSSEITVEVRVIDSTTDIHIPPNILFVPEIKGHNDLSCPSYSFLITHGRRHILFDLGARKQLDTYAPSIRERALKWAKVDKDVADILNEGSAGIKPADVEAVVVSHHHWDHIGDMTTFPTSTAFIVGPGFKHAFIPGYPTNPDSPMLDADVKDRVFREIDIKAEGKGLKIGDCDAFDFFEDGSFYLLSTPGHAPGHIAGLARVTHSPDTLILMAGDACHHGGEIRPTQYIPLPSEVKPSPIPGLSTCPGTMLQQLQHNHSATEPFYSVKPGFPTNFDECEASLHKIQGMDAHDSVLVAMAHDPALAELLDMYPKKANNWKQKGVKAASRWAFLKDFRVAIEELVAE